MSLTTGTSAPTPHFNETPMVSSALLGIVNRPWRSGRRRPRAAACFGTRRSHSPLQRLVLRNLYLRPRLPPSHPNHVRSRLSSLQDMFVTLLQAGFLFLYRNLQFALHADDISVKFCFRFIRTGKKQKKKKEKEERNLSLTV